ncbi:MAG: hypothetical protein IPG90_04550 [Bacteroidetes bacterium]|nr:hypothetical protein [Bacteroidota bacterium]
MMWYILPGLLMLFIFSTNHSKAQLNNSPIQKIHFGFTLGLNSTNFKVTLGSWILRRWTPFM